MVFVGECDVVKTENKDNTVLLKDNIVENMVVNKNPTIREVTTWIFFLVILKRA